MSVVKIDNVLTWASDMETNTLLQAARTSRLPFLAGPLALMPDAHVGMGSTIGSVIPTQGAIIPAAIGVDIGCGMIAVETDLTAADLPDTLDPLIKTFERVIPAGVGQGHDNRYDKLRIPTKLGADYPELVQRDRSLWTKSQTQFGSLGGGNHFVEVELDERMIVWVVLHSGSRGVGKEIAERHIAKAKGLMKQMFVKLEDPSLAYLVEGTPEFQEYIHDMLWAQEYALGNRDFMMTQAIEALFSYVGKGREVNRIQCHHNYTTREHHHGKDVWLTRKGAIRAREGDLGIIPGSMATGSFIVRGLGNPASYFSASHGAGRRLSRSGAKRELSVDTLKTAMAGKSWNVDKAEQLVDEHPAAYKDIGQVMADQADLVEVVHSLRQLLNFKGTK